MNNLPYRVVTAGGVGRLHKTYFKNYTHALNYFIRASRSLHPYGYAELQELERGAWLTNEQTAGGGF